MLCSIYEKTQLQSHTTFSSDKLGVHNKHRCNTITWLCPNLWCFFPCLYRHYTHKLVIKETYGPVLSPTYAYNFGIPSFQFFFFPLISTIFSWWWYHDFESRRMSLCTSMRRGDVGSIVRMVSGEKKHGGTPIAGWLISWKIPIENGWFKGRPISGNLYIHYILNGQLILI